MPVLKASQEMFDELVRENMDEFEMSREEAVTDALAQLVSQGIRDHSNLLTASPQEHAIGRAVSVLAAVLAAAEYDYHSSNGSSSNGAALNLDKLQPALEQLHDALVLATANDLLDSQQGMLVSYTVSTAPTLVKVLTKLQAVRDLAPNGLACWALALQSLVRALAYMPTRREQIDYRAAELLVKLVEDGRTLLLQSSTEVGQHAALSSLLPSLRDAMNALVVSCMNNEELRVRYMLEFQLAGCLVGTLRAGRDALVAFADNAELGIDIALFLLAVCSGIVCLSSDDDERGDISRAHDNCRDLVEAGALEALMAVAVAAAKHQAASDARLQALRAEIAGTLARLAVKNEFCEQLMDGNVAGLLEDTLAADAQANTSVARSIAVLGKALAGNDKCKAALGKSATFIPLLIECMNRHPLVPAVQDAISASLAALALRSPENSERICRGIGGDLRSREANGSANHDDSATAFPGISALLTAITLHPKAARVQRSVAQAIRNLVSRSPELRKPFLDNGAEELLRQARLVSLECDDAAKAALRDLGCDVDFKEPFKGVKGGLANDEFSAPSGPMSSPFGDSGLSTVTSLSDIVRNTL
ncbi:Armc6 protein [Capsaspora owczarzaki ATCC 30864]|uniref:Armc6 protein n=1 Tax=Capsaspora owczarzaki (strain ATCC 30864) TaxID=595528 RepID=A0A0D2VW11_CAPO3|nr:Armc6 protein [Capsaspora owczarzaki ATCC 30864]KJE95682.1 Armc6 protein [Capsaspora owczarzaki ATCC 30864]|eukprot:XP_004345698.2 Armc6 protein [Capsaspora owczarzaki ATCC 30864]